MWSAGWTSGTKTRVIWIVLHRSESLHIWGESVTNDIIRCVHLLLEAQGQQATQVLVVDVQRAIGGDVRWEDGAVGSIQAVALLLAPVRQMGASIVLVNDAELGNVVDACEHGDAVGGRRVLAIHESELIVGQLLFLRHDVLGQFQKRILVTPEQLADRHLNEWLDFQNVHNTGHGQAEKPVRRRNGVDEFLCALWFLLMFDFRTLIRMRRSSKV